ncbi:MAG TPA: hypothetical protein VNT79_10045 [Phycisphaerae bacterium]|nr:hypothetical protein [Phycisphaerae bacterium]
MFVTPKAARVAEMLALLIAIQPAIATAEIRNITGSSSATVIQFEGVVPVQSDFAQVLIPFTQAEPPALSAAQVDRIGKAGDTTAAGSVLSVFTEPNFSATAPPNDVGIDLAGFADDDVTSWFLKGEASETRTIAIEGAEAAGGDLLLGATASDRGQSRVILSGVMFISSRDVSRDLTGAEVKLRVGVQRREFGKLPSDLVAGDLVLAGGPNGEVTVSRSDGSFAGVFMPVIDFSGTVTELPLVRAILFAGLELPYEYDFEVGVPFELELTVTAEARTIPGGVGASAVFGLPQLNLPEVMLKVAKDDRGTQLASAIAQRVDTTGATYQNGGGPFLPGICGAMGIETLWLAFAGLMFIGAAYQGRSVGRRRRH